MCHLFDDFHIHVLPVAQIKSANSAGVILEVQVWIVNPRQHSFPRFLFSKLKIFRAFKAKNVDEAQKFFRTSKIVFKMNAV